MNSLLVRGLRNTDDTDPEGGVHPAHAEDWCVLVTRAIQGEWPPIPSERTREAENGLGIHNKPYYFYALRAETFYGLVVFVLREVEGLDWPECARGATPFDSGDWWFGKIQADRRLDLEERRVAFQKWDVPLPEWRVAFEQYILANYSTVGDYIEGRAPATENRPPGNGFTIIKGQPNTARAWTWEVRVPHDLIAERLALWKVYMNKTSLGEYDDWLTRSPLAVSDRRRLHEWVNNKTNVVEVPGKGDVVVLAVNNAIAREVGNG